MHSDGNMWLDGTNQVTETEYLFRSYQLLRQQKYTLTYKELEGLLMCYYNPATCHYPEPSEYYSLPEKPTSLRDFLI